MDRGLLSGRDGPYLACRVGAPRFGAVPGGKAPWAQRIAVPVAGEGERRSLGCDGGSAPIPPGGLARRRWILQPAHPRAHDRRCPSQADRGNGHPSTCPSQDIVMAGLLCGESRSGPDPLKLGRRGIREEGHVAGCAVRWGLNPGGHIAATRFPRRSRLCSWIEQVAARPGLGKRAAFDGAASGDGPGASTLGGESNPVNPRAGARQRATEAGSRP